MMLRLVTFSNAFILALLLAGQAVGLSANVTGRVRLTHSTNAGVKNKRNCSGVVVWLVPRANSPVAQVVKKHAVMLQKDKMFTPHILVISTGTSVDFPNMDPIFHNAFSNFDGKIFDIGLYPPGSSRSVRFDRPGIVRVFCNIHPSMSAIIIVVDSPYFAVTDDNGDFSIPNVAAGAYELHFFHERATPETLEKLIRPVLVAETPLNLAQVSISETGYLPVAHKNKYGRDYPANAGEEGVYSAPFK